MNYTRRDWTILLSAAVATSDAMAQKTALASEILRYEDLPVHKNGSNASRPILHGDTHTGLPIELHETELAPGEAPHPPHHHVHEEMLMIREGTLEVTIAGRSANLGPGSVAFVASGDHHGWRNVGTTRARYYVLALGRDDA
jgi:mannose-6-phosphate isomerase-like protein (cupin superfamily)